MKRLAFVLAVIFINQVLMAEDYGRVTVFTAKGDTVKGYTKPLIKDERKTFKVSPLPDGKNAVKYSAKDVSEVRYISESGNVEVWCPKKLDGDVLLMKKVKDTGKCTLWKVPVKFKQSPTAQFLLHSDVISFKPDTPGADAWYAGDLVKGRGCKKLPQYKEFLKQYKAEHPKRKISSEDVDGLLDMCDIYAEKVLHTVR